MFVFVRKVKINIFPRFPTQVIVLKEKRHNALYEKIDQFIDSVEDTTRPLKTTINQV